MEFRQAINAAKNQFELVVETIATYDMSLEKSIQIHPDCKKLLKLEGFGPINAVDLYISLGCAELGTFNRSSAPILRINSPVHITKAINDDVLSLF